MSEKEMKSAKDELHDRLQQYLDADPAITSQNKTHEFEFRFSKPGKGPGFSKIDYDNVIKQLKSAGFVSKNQDGIQMLRIYSEYTDPKTGQEKLSNIRAEITGADLIAEYCATNNLQKVIDMPSTKTSKLKFTQKLSITGQDGKFQKPIDFHDMGLRADYKIESDFSVTSRLAKEIIETWTEKKKKFRMMNRVRFEHPDFPVAMDLSIIKSNQTTTNRQKRKVDMINYTIQDAKVFEDVPKYEIEMEILNAHVGKTTDYTTADRLIESLRKIIRIVMSAIQGTPYPIMQTEREDVLQEYLEMVHGERYEKRGVRNSDFIGPSSSTLQMLNILNLGAVRTKVPNIRRNYMVTEKADGERKMLFINRHGKLYLLDFNMNVQFTGKVTENKQLFGTLLDGEHVKYAKNGQFINLYKAFDLYFVNGRNFMKNPFYLYSDKEKEKEKEKDEKKEKNSRLSILSEFTKVLKMKSITDSKKPDLCPFRVESKNFYTERSIFEACGKVLNQIKDGVYEYNTDGLIFTPTDLPVGSIEAGLEGPLRKYTWEASFKWKPVEYNTVDFLVGIEKDKYGKDRIQHVFKEGTNLQTTNTLLEYKTLKLMCGFDPKKHLLENAFNEILHERLPKPTDIDNESTYEPRLFEPTEPYDPNAWKTNVFVKTADRVLVTQPVVEDSNHEETPEYFEENMIVEFRYDKTAEPGWNWIPIRVRYDKTQRLLAGLPEYGNAYHVANSNWHSIHNEITEEMITTGRGIPEDETVDEVYYGGQITDSRTTSMRNFHNLYVKKKLILGAANAMSDQRTLIDYAVGKAGDLPKWVQANLDFVMGVDLAANNVTDQVNGACVRYLEECRRRTKVPYCIFLQGNSGLNLRNGDAFAGDRSSKERMVAAALFGSGPKDEMLLGKGVYNRYGIAHNGFGVSSCQFALHYFFENPTILHQFMRNLSENTRLQGYFVCTGYDGNAVFDLLRKKKADEGVAFVVGGGKKICEIVKKYDYEGFSDDETSIGYMIHVFQETIQKTSREYLVNFRYFVRIMENYGFELISDADARLMGLPHASGLFGELFQMMEEELMMDQTRNQQYKSAPNMSSAEKQISFLNRYSIFRKTTTVSKSSMENYAKMAKELSEKNGDLFGEADLESEFVRIENERDLDFDRSSVRKLIVRIVLRSGKQNQEDEKTIENESLLRQEPEEEPTDKEEKKPKANEDKKPEANEEKKPKVVSKPKVVFKGQKKVIFKEKI